MVERNFMKKWLVYFIACMFLLTGIPAYAQTGAASPEVPKVKQEQVKKETKKDKKAKKQTKKQKKAAKKAKKADKKAAKKAAPKTVAPKTEPVRP
jgi:Skp family chaperone for outer membrane proteins